MYFLKHKMKETKVVKKTKNITTYQNTVIYYFILKVVNKEKKNEQRTTCIKNINGNTANKKDREKTLIEKGLGGPSKQKLKQTNRN